MVFLVSLLLSVSLHLAAERVDAVRQQPAGPTGGAVVALRVTMPSGMTASLRVPEGRAAVLAPVDGDAVWLVPAVGDVLTLSVWLGNPLEAGADASRAGTIVLRPGRVTEYTDSHTAFAVEWTGTYWVIADGAATDGPCQTCCVTCGEYTVCGCAVQMACASCCCPTVCSCEGGSTCVVSPASLSRRPGKL